jgi:hypothetical protein
VKSLDSAFATALRCVVLTSVCGLTIGCANTPWLRDTAAGDHFRPETADVGSDLRRSGTGEGAATLSERGRQIEKNLGF